MSDLVRREPRPAHLSKPEQRTLAEALRRGEATRKDMEDRLVAYGEWLLENVFDGDASRALDTRPEQTPLWLELVRRAGGPTLRMSRKVLYVALEIAARDKRINDDVWRELDPGRKELLLPLGDETMMRKAARQVTNMKMSQDATRAYVAELRAQAGQPAQPRFTAAALSARLRKLREAYGSASARRRIEKLGAQMSTTQRAALAAEVRAVSAWLGDVSAALQKRA